ncbi:MAG: hypothetical protein KBD78_07430 [Oligoflexales bacterium]|nr:hypothetical protein [Oligoflexales bacterium]
MFLMETRLFLIRMIFCSIYMLLLSACVAHTKNNLAKASEYKAAQLDFFAEDYNSALQSYPKTEADGFIKEFETSYLGLLAKEPAQVSAINEAQSLEEKKTEVIGNELNQFFIKETSSGYFPAEHEAILFHIVLGLSYAQNGERAKARVEAKRAARYLQGHFAERIGSFDDAGLRLLLAALWIYTDEWKSAQVDLRVAAKLDEKLRWLNKITEQKVPPKKMFLVFAGQGPEPKYYSDTTNTEASSSIVLDSNFMALDLKIVDNKSSESLLATTLTNKHWYVRHGERNLAVRETLQKSKSYGDVILAGISSGAVYLGAVLAGFVTVATTLAAGLALILLAPRVVMVDDGKLLGGAMKEGMSVGTEIVENGKDFSIRNTRSILDQSESYRFVRFLPDATSVAFSNSDFANPQLKIAEERLSDPLFSLNAEKSSAEIHFFAYSTKSHPSFYKDVSVPRLDKSSKQWWLALNGATDFVHAKGACEEIGNFMGLPMQIPGPGSLMQAEKGGLSLDAKASEYFWLENKIEHSCLLYNSKSKIEAYAPSCLQKHGVVCTSERQQ